MFPELRAERMKEVTARIKDEFDGDLRGALTGPIARARKILKSFPSIGDPGADRILLFAKLQPVAAVPSNCTGVLERIQSGKEAKNYNASYHAAQRMIDSEIAATFEARELNVEERQQWGAALELGDKARNEIRGNDLAYYLDRLEQVRTKTLAELARRDDRWLEEQTSFGNGQKVNNYFKWFHVCGHEINHRGQIRWLRSRATTREATTG